MSPQCHAVRLAVLVTMSAIGMMLADKEKHQQKTYPMAISVANMSCFYIHIGEQPCLFCLSQYVYTLLRSAIFHIVVQKLMLCCASVNCPVYKLVSLHIAHLHTLHASVEAAPAELQSCCFLVSS